jgi:hypothetical protein
MEQPSDNSRRRFLKASTMLGLGAAFGQGMIAKAFANAQPAVISNRPIGANAIRPFHVQFSDQELADLRRRIQAARWPERELVADASQGVQLKTMQRVGLGTAYLLLGRAPGGLQIVA